MEVFLYSLNDGPTKDDLPSVLQNKLSTYAVRRSAEFNIHQNNKLAFVCRAMYLTNEFKRTHDYPRGRYNYEIADVYLASQFRGQGLSKIYMKKIIESIASKTTGLVLWTTLSNQIAIKLYISLGFKQTKAKTKLMMEWERSHPSEATIMFILPLR